MSAYDSAALLDLFNRLVGRTGTDAITPESKYTRLSEAQTAIVADIASIYPACLYPTTLPALTTTDNKTFTFGTSANGAALAPIGKTTIYTSLADVPTNPWKPGVDYLPLGSTGIQIPNDRSYGGTLYWRGIAPPGVLDATHQPVLFPEGARVLIAHRAAIAFCKEGNRNPDLAVALIAEYGRPLALNPGLFASWMLTWKTAYAGGGALGSLTGRSLALQ